MCLNKKEAKDIATFVQGTTRICVRHAHVRDDCRLAIRVSLPDTSTCSRINGLQIGLTSNLHHQAFVILTHPARFIVWEKFDVLKPTIEFNGRLSSEAVWSWSPTDIPHGKNTALVTRSWVIRDKLDSNAVESIC